MNDTDFELVDDLQMTPERKEEIRQLCGDGTLDAHEIKLTEGCRELLAGLDAAERKYARAYRVILAARDVRDGKNNVGSFLRELVRYDEETPNRGSGYYEVVFVPSEEP